MATLTALLRWMSHEPLWVNILVVAAGAAYCRYLFRSRNT